MFVLAFSYEMGLIQSTEDMVLDHACCWFVEQVEDCQPQSTNIKIAEAPEELGGEVHDKQNAPGSMIVNEAQSPEPAEVEAKEEWATPRGEEEEVPEGTVADRAAAVARFDWSEKVPGTVPGHFDWAAVAEEEALEAALARRVGELEAVRKEREALEGQLRALGEAKMEECVPTDSNDAPQEVKL